ncbi:metal-sulfur cluster assembly factor [Brucella sp. BE17]|uniref:metal-sulfur cluster assembly factor n=1 Tax=Brucella sp. BE17 TaxID=3142977 RepID=UPI0031BA9FC8
MQYVDSVQLETEIRDALRIVMDPELGINLVDLGMIYRIDVDTNGDVSVQMTTTTRGCPAAGFLTQAVQACIEDVSGVRTVKVELTYEPAWSPEMAIAEAQARFAVPAFR